MSPTKLRALVVDDEPQMRTIVGTVLSNEGFSCGFAANGIEALERLAKHRFDVVITDLRMPNRHGHALIQDLLKLENRPFIVVLTGLDEPRLTKDMIARGVDDVVFKPVNFPAFAAKVKALVQRNSDRAPLGMSAEAKQAPRMPTGKRISLSMLSTAELDAKLANVSALFPMSQSALEVYQMACSDDFEAHEIAGTIERDASLAIELLRIGNSSYYNPSGNAISDLEQIVIRIGRRQIGEVALLTNTLTVLTAGLVSWMDVGTVWKRSVAAGIASELLMQQRVVEASSRELQLSASMQCLGRVVMATLYPDHYQSMLEQCRIDGTTLEEQESRVFPKSPPEVMSQLLAQWKIPAHIHLPLRYVADDYSALASLSGQLRNTTELVKLAVLIGQIAAGDWSPWDRVDLPPANILRRLGIRGIDDLVEATCDGLARVMDNAPIHWLPKNPPVSTPDQQVNYFGMSGAQVDILAAMLPSLGIRPVWRSAREIADFDEDVLVNCLGMSNAALDSSFPAATFPRLAVVTGRANKTTFSRLSQVLGLPVRFDALRAFCDQIVKAPACQSV